MGKSASEQASRDRQLPEVTVIEQARGAWNDFWYGEVESIRLEALRQGLGYCLLAYMLLRSQYATEWLTAGGFHPSPVADPNNTQKLKSA